MSSAPAAVGVDIGGQTVRAGLISAAGELLKVASRPTPAGGDPALLTETVSALVAEVLGGAAVARVGVALPGLRDPATGVILRAVNLPRLEGIRPAELFRAALGHDVRIEGDMNAAGYAQWRRLRQPARFVYLTLGTGAGAAVILDGAIVRHTRGAGGHLGHLVVDTAADAPVCGCGLRGCLEAVVCGAARGGSADWRVRAAAGLAIGFAHLTHIYAPEVIVVGGGVIEHHPALFDEAAAGFGGLRSSLAPAGLRIVRAPLTTDDAGVIGAALLA
jgi:glucokinase